MKTCETCKQEIKVKSYEKSKIYYFIEDIVIEKVGLLLAVATILFMVGTVIYHAWGLVLTCLAWAALLRHGLTIQDHVKRIRSKIKVFIFGEEPRYNANETSKLTRMRY